jgi:type II secretion system protein H
MPISATGAEPGSSERWPADAGVSLIEVLVTLTIVGLMAGMVVLMAPPPDRYVRDSAQGFAARLANASEQSVVRNRALALMVRENGYGFAWQERTGWREVRDSGPLTFQPLPGGVAMSVERDASLPVDVARPVALFEPVGAATPASFVFSGAGARWRVTLEASGRSYAARID